MRNRSLESVLVLCENENEKEFVRRLWNQLYVPGTSWFDLVRVPLPGMKKKQVGLSPYASGYSPSETVGDASRQLRTTAGRRPLRSLAPANPDPDNACGLTESGSRAR